MVARPQEVRRLVAMISALRSALTCRELEHEGCRKDLREARAETERLRAALARLHCPDSAACRDETVRELTAEAERLRDALDAIVESMDAQGIQGPLLVEAKNALAAIDAAMRGEG
jgi:hypothetical protein